VQLTAGFEVPLPVEPAWDLLQDISRVAGWFPGARLDEAEGDTYRGTVRVKLGPMLVDYRGTATFLERDEDAHRVVIEASGREQRGAGTARARAVTELSPVQNGTEVAVTVELDITGRPAQLGQSLMQDVARRLVAEFAARMAADLAAPDPSSPGGPPPAASPAGGDGEAAAAPRRAAPHHANGDRGASAGDEDGDSSTVPAGRDGSIRRGAPDGAGDALDLGRLAGAVLARRLAPIAAGAVAVAALVLAVARTLRRRQRS
jgi:carbon monoxide dehydrogenase subunit G